MPDPKHPLREDENTEHKPEAPPAQPGKPCWPPPEEG